MFNGSRKDCFRLKRNYKDGSNAKSPELNFQDIVDRYLEQIFMFCVQKTGIREDAEDLSQDIMVEIYKSSKKLEHIEFINAWVWRIVRNTYYHWINRKKKHEQYIVYDGSHEFDLLYFNGDEEQKAILNSLNQEISFLSKKHREIIVSYYLKKEKIKQIAIRLDLPVGSVKRLLFEGRKNIKKGLNKMRTYGEKCHTPEELGIGINGKGGVGGRPFSLVTRKLAQNLLVEAYYEPKTVEQLSLATGVACPYVEDELQILVDGELMKEITSGSYLTDFIIFNENMHKKLYNQRLEGAQDILPDFRAVINEIRDEFFEQNMSSQDFSWQRILWMMIYHLENWVFNDCSQSDFDKPIRKDGGRWVAFGNIKNSYLLSDEFRKSYLNGPFCKTYDNGSCRIASTYWTRGQLFHVAGDQNQIIISQGDFSLCRQIFFQKLDENLLSDSDKDRLAQLIEKNIIEEQDGRLLLLITAFSSSQFQQIDNLIKSKITCLKSKAKKMVESLVAIIQQNVPKRFSEDIIWERAKVDARIEGFVYNDFIEKGELEPVEPEQEFTPTMYFVFNE